MPRPICKLALTNCLDNSSIIPFGCFMFTNFCILCTPSLLLTFISYQHYYGYIRPCGWFMKAYYLLRVLRLMILPLCRSYVLAHLQTFLPIGHIQPVQVLHCRQLLLLIGSSSFMRLSVSPVGFIPDAANTSGNL